MTLPAPLATAIGSLPFDDEVRSVDLMLDSLPQAPCWPQLPKRSWLENMDAQFAEGLPAVREVGEEGRVTVVTEGGEASAEEALERFWTPIIEGREPEWAGISRERAGGLYELLSRFTDGSEERKPVLKGQITGPVTFGTTVKTDPSGRLLLFNDEFFEASRALLKAKAAWQARQLGAHADRALVFVDEPSLVSFGSAFLPVEREQVISWMDEVIAGVHDEGALAGSHCCGNTDWSILMETALDVINFDADEYFDNVMLYSRQLAGFLERGGYLAFGIVPTEETVLQTTALDALAKLDDQIKRLGQEIDWPRSKLLERLIVTPACGYGTRSEEAALRGTPMCQQIVDKLA